MARETAPAFRAINEPCRGFDLGDPQKSICVPDLIAEIVFDNLSVTCHRLRRSI